jgi:hypothetical protein
LSEKKHGQHASQETAENANCQKESQKTKHREEEKRTIFAAIDTGNPGELTGGLSIRSTEYFMSGAVEDTTGLHGDPSVTEEQVWETTLRFLTIHPNN